MSGDSGPILLIGQGEQYWDEQDWRELVRSKRIRRGTDVAVREYGQTAFRPVEDVPGLRRILDELDPLPNTRRPATPMDLPVEGEPQLGGRAAPLTGAAAPGAVGPAALLNAELDRGQTPGSFEAPTDRRDRRPDDGPFDSPGASPHATSPAERGRGPSAALISLCVLGVVVVGVLAMSLSGRSSSGTAPPAAGGLQVSAEANTPAPGAVEPAAAPTDVPAPAAQNQLEVASEASETGSEAAPPSEAQGPSFDCAKAVDWSARQVCADASLAASDRRMAELYARRMAASSTDSAAQLRDEQRAWVARRKSCEITADPACLRDAYSARLAELGASPEAAPGRSVSEPTSAPSGDPGAARSAAAAARACVQRGDLDCAEANLTTLLELQPGRADARRLLDRLRAQRQRGSSGAD